MSPTRPMTRIVAALAALCLVLAGVAGWALVTRNNQDDTSESAEHRVASDGDDAPAGTAAAPWATLQHAVDQAVPGSTVTVRGGVYTQQLAVQVSGEPGRPIVVRNAPSEHPVLDGSSIEVGQSFDSMISIEDQRYRAALLVVPGRRRTRRGGRRPRVGGVPGVGRRRAARVERRPSRFQVSAPIAADLSGVEQLELIVTSGVDGRSNDHADWGDARLSC